MTKTGVNWLSRGFAAIPDRRVSEGTGLLLYRCWGTRRPGVGSGEWGTGYFSLEKPSSVLDAELRFNIVDWDNAVNFVSTFRLRPGFEYFVGPVAHGESDISRIGSQVFIEQPLDAKLELVKSKEVLRHDVFVGPKDGNA